MATRETNTYWTYFSDKNLLMLLGVVVILIILSLLTRRPLYTSAINRTALPAGAIYSTGSSYSTTPVYSGTGFKTAVPVNGGTPTAPPVMQPQYPTYPPSYTQYNQTRSYYQY